jgi:1,4-dihydroxy-2-naphthoate octaprenyltransferase
MRDVESDKKSNKITLVVKMGIHNAKIYHAVIIGLAIVLSGLFGILYFTSFYNLIFVVAYIPLIIHIKKVLKNTDPKLLDPELKKVALTTVLLAVLMGIGHLL